MNQKPLTSRLDERFGGNPLSPAQEAQLVAQSFGVSYPVGESLPESEVSVGHVEDDQTSSLLLDNRKTPKQRVPPRSLFEIATARLESVKPRSQAQMQRVAQMLLDMREPLAAIDNLIGELEGERLQAISDRWEELKARGRDLREKIDNEFQAHINSALMSWNDAETKKVRAETRLQVCVDERRRLRLDRYSTEQQLADGDHKVLMSVRALNVAKAEHLEAERAKAEAENARKLAESELISVERAMDQCVAEINGAQYHDPETGLSISPTAYQESW